MEEKYIKGQEPKGFNLSEKRKELYRENIKLCTTKDEELLVKNIFIWLEKQDAEFIKKLKEDVCFNNSLVDGYACETCLNCRKINKLTEDSLVGGKDD